MQKPLLESLIATLSAKIVGEPAVLLGETPASMGKAISVAVPDLVSHAVALARTQAGVEALQRIAGDPGRDGAWRGCRAGLSGQGWRDHLLRAWTRCSRDAGCRQPGLCGRSALHRERGRCITCGSILRFRGWKMSAAMMAAARRRCRPILGPNDRVR